jgi:hypothetical protein
VFLGIEHQSIQYVVDCTRPNAVRGEHAIRRQRMSPADRARFYPCFNLDTSGTSEDMNPLPEE